MLKTVSNHVTPARIYGMGNTRHERVVQRLKCVFSGMYAPQFELPIDA